MIPTGLINVNNGRAGSICVLYNYHMNVNIQMKGAYKRLSSYKYDKAAFSGNPHIKTVKALSTFDEIRILYSRYNRNLGLYRSGYIKSRRLGQQFNESRIFTYIRTDYNSLILTIHRYLFYLIKVFDNFPKELKNGVKTSGFSSFYTSIEASSSPLHQFFLLVQNEIGILEYQLAFYRDLYLEHNDRISTDWKTISPLGKDYFVRHIPDKHLSAKEYEKMTSMMEKVFKSEVFYVLGSRRKTYNFILKNWYRFEKKDRVLLKPLILKTEFISPNLNEVILATCAFTNAVIDLIEEVTV
jgi:hypothetical protein